MCTERRDYENVTLPLVDTGFDGGLMLPRAFADHLHCPIVGRLAFEMVGGTRLFAPVGLVNIEWLYEVRQIEIIVSEGSDALIGTELLQKTMLLIDYFPAESQYTQPSE